MKRGRKPALEKIGKGDPRYRPCRHDGRVADSFDGAPIKPDFGKDEVAAKTWDFVSGSVPKDVLAKADELTLTALCRWYSIYVRLFDLYETDLDRMTMTQLDKAWRNFEKLAALFGLNPADRMRMKISSPREEADDPMAKQLGVIG